MIPTMQPPTTGWNPETQHVRSNGVGRQPDAINTFGLNPLTGYAIPGVGVNPLTGYPVNGLTPTVTPYGTTGFVPAAGSSSRMTPGFVPRARAISSRRCSP